MPRQTSYIPQSSSSRSDLCDACDEPDSFGLRLFQGHRLCYSCFELAMDGEDFWWDEEERHELF